MIYSTYLRTALSGAWSTKISRLTKLKTLVSISNNSDLQWIRSWLAAQQSFRADSYRINLTKDSHSCSMVHFISWHRTRLLINSDTGLRLTYTTTSSCLPFSTSWMTISLWNRVPNLSLTQSWQTRSSTFPWLLRSLPSLNPKRMIQWLMLCLQNFQQICKKASQIMLLTTLSRGSMTLAHTSRLGCCTTRGCCEKISSTLNSPLYIFTVEVSSVKTQARIRTTQGSGPLSSMYLFLVLTIAWHPDTPTLFLSTTATRHMCG